jgi:methionyl aminopeptidase
MIIIKSKKAIDRMRTAGKLLAEIMENVGSQVVEGNDTLAVNDWIEAEMRRVGLRPECKGYAGYQHATCISLNDVVVHGVPNRKIVLKSRDFVKIDVAGSYKKYCADMARYFFVGKASAEAEGLAKAAQDALDGAVKLIAPKVRLIDISSFIQDTVENRGFGIVRTFAGHGIGRSLHEEPEIPNYKSKDERDVVLREGMTLAIEPMITEHAFEVKIMEDGWTARTVDGGLAAHVEDTVLVTSDGAEVLTRLHEG